MRSSILKKVAVTATAVAMMMSVATAVSAAPTSETDSGRLRFYANGSAIVLDAGTTKDYTVVYEDINRDGKVDAGDKIVEIANAKGKADESGYDLSDFAIFGGSRIDLTADTQITMLGGEVALIYGANFESDLRGNTTIDIQGGFVNNQVFGGGIACEMNGNVKVTVAAKENVKWKVYAGGVEATGSKVISTVKPVMTIADGLTVDSTTTVTVVAPTATPAPTAEPTTAPTATPAPTAEPTTAPTATPAPVVTAEPTEKPVATATPAPVVTEEPTATPAPVVTEAPTATPAPVVTTAPTEGPTSPETGDNMNLFAIFAVSVLALAGVGFTFVKKMNAGK